MRKLVIQCAVFILLYMIGWLTVLVILNPILASFSGNAGLEDGLKRLGAYVKGNYMAPLRIMCAFQMILEGIIVGVLFFHAAKKEWKLAKLRGNKQNAK